MSSVTSATSTSTTAAQTASAAASQGGSLGKDAFLKLLVAQMKNQDPLQPTQGTEYVTQLAQFTQVEQAMSQTQTLSTLSAQLTGLQANEAVALIGKQVTVRGQSLTYDGVNQATASVKLGAAANDVTVSVKDASGKVIRTLKLGPAGQGPLKITWDGKDLNGQMVSPGSYSFDVSATTKDGAPVDVSKDVTGTVTKVSFDKGYPVVVLDSGVTAPISDLVSAAAAPAKT
jgi:flagellar basal-body rod modification protein FlgD